MLDDRQTPIHVFTNYKKHCIVATQKCFMSFCPKDHLVEIYLSVLSLFKTYYD